MANPPLSPQFAGQGRPLERASTLGMDGTEPRMFPGVVSRHRKSSVQQAGSGGMAEARASRGGDVEGELEAAVEDGDA